MKPICVPCERFYRPIKNGSAFVEGMPTGGINAAPGKAQPWTWKPYKLWMGDKWACPDCGAEIIVGVGMNPLSEHYLPGFSDAVKQFDGGQLLVKDC